MQNKSSAAGFRDGCQNHFLWHPLGMKTFLAAALLFIGLLATARAQQEADTQYLGIYGTIQLADKLADSGQPGEALAAFTDAQVQLERFKKIFPDWNPNIISFRLNYVADKAAALKSRTPAAPSAPAKGTAPAAPSAENAARLQTQVDGLNEQLQSAQAENSALQAKLKEALATQPAVIDAGELTRAQEQVRSLMKQNDLLKASRGATPEKIVVTDTNAIVQAREELDSYIKKYTAEQARAGQLAAENDKLRQDLKLAGDNAAAIGVLRDENSRLKDQLAALKTAAASAADRDQLAADLKDARAQIATLKTAVVTAATEKAALEKKVSELAAAPAPDTAGYEARIRKLTDERDDLLQQLDAAKLKNSRRRDSAPDPKLAALNQQVETLRARLAVHEAGAVPFTKEELALFRQAAPPVVSAQPAKKSIHELPAGTAELAASAQQHFARGEFDEAGADYRKILERDQNNGLALANLATIELQQDKLDDAEKHITAAVAQSPNDAYNLSTLGYLKFRQEKYDDALDALSRAAALDPNNPEIQNYLGVTLSHKGQRTQAETALRKAIRLNPLYAPAHNNLAVIYLNQQPPAPLLARWHYQKALAAGQPRNPELEKALADKGAPVDAQ